MNILNSYFLASPSTALPVSSRKISRQTNTQYQYFNSEYKKSSSIGLYSALPKSHSTERRRRDLTSRSQHSKGLLIQNSKNDRVEKTIDSVNKYAEQLKLTLLNQYKTHKMQSLLAKKGKRINQPLTSPTEFEDNDCRNMSKQNSHPAYKTLNILYQAIIDNSFQHSNKQRWKLPIVERVNNQNQTIQYQSELKTKTESPPKRDLCVPLTVYRTKRTNKSKASFHIQRQFIKRQKSRLAKIEDDIDIIPWRTSGQNNFD